MGSGSKTGKITFTIADGFTTIVPTAIKVMAPKYGSDTGKLSVTACGKTTQLTPGSDEQTINLTGNTTPLTEITFATTSKRAYVSYFIVEYTSGPVEVQNLAFSPLSVDFGARDNFTVSPADFAADVQNLTLTPADGSIAGIDSLTYAANKAGTTTVNVSWEEGTKYKAGTASFEFTVKTLKPALSWSEESVVCEQGENVTLPILTNTIASLKPVITSSNTAVAVVADDGTVSLVGGIGTATIAATIAAVDGENEEATASYTITVNPKGALAAPVFNPNGGTFTLDEAIFEITTKAGTIYYGIGTTKEEATTEYTDAIVIEKPGEYNYVAYAVDGERVSEIATATFVVNKNKADFGYAVDAATVALGSDDAFPALNNPNIYEYTLTSSAPSVAAVSPLGDKTIWALAEGTATITAKYVGSDEVEAAEASYTLTVGPAKPALETVTTTFDFTKNNYGMTPVDGNGAYNETNAPNKSISFSDGDVTITTAKGNGNGTRLLSNKDGNQFRIYGSSSATVSVPENCKLISVSYTDADANDAKIDVTITNGTAKIGSSSQIRIHQITVTYTKPGEPSAVASELAFSDNEREALVDELTEVEGATAAEGATIGYKLLDASGAEAANGEVDVTDGIVSVYADAVGEYTLLAYVAPGNGFIPAIAKTIVSVRDMICPSALYLHGHFYDRYYKLDEPVEMTKNGKVFTATDILIGSNKDVADGDLGYVFTTHLPVSARSAAHQSDWSQLTEGYVFHDGGTTKASDVNSQSDFTPYKVEKEGFYDITADFTDAENPQFTADFKDTTTGIEGVAVAGDGKDEYFDLTGRRVVNPSAGVYLRRTGTETQKIMLR